MTLGSDDALSLRGGCKPAEPGEVATCFTIIADNGKFRLTKTSTTKYIRLYSDTSGDDLIGKYSYTLTADGAKLTDTADTSKKYDATFEADPTSPAGVLGADIGSSTLSCVPSAGDPPKFDLFVDSTGIDVNATNSRDGTYSVDSSELLTSSLKMSLSNTVDGPLAEDVLELPLDGLAALASGSTSVDGTDTYSEQYDGTTSHYTIHCTI